MKTSFNISILGGRGYVGQEIIKIINNHPNFFISDIYSKASQGKLVDDYTKSKSLTYKLLDSPDKLDFKLKNPFYIPNPCDESFETLENYKNECENDLFFAMSHGVHRGQLKKGKFDNREKFLNELIKRNNEIKFDVYGMNNIQPIWSNKFIECISKSSMLTTLFTNPSVFA